MGWRLGAFEPLDRTGAVAPPPGGHCFENTGTLRCHDEDGNIVDPDDYDVISYSGVTAYEAVIDDVQDALR